MLHKEALRYSRALLGPTEGAEDQQWAVRITRLNFGTHGCAQDQQACSGTPETLRVTQGTQDQQVAPSTKEKHSGPPNAYTKEKKQNKAKEKQE